MKKGSITVFLSLVLVLLFSFLLTTLEAARIRGASAYTSMLSDLAGDSLLAAYYYPLFQNYRLFGIEMGDEKGFFSESRMEEQLEENISYGIGGLKGGLLKFQKPEVSVQSYETMLTFGEKEFLSQIRQQVVLDGLSLALHNLFSEEQFTEAGVAGEIYQEQEAALEATAKVTEDVIRLMELVDGICMGKNGINFDKNGKLQVNDSFIKQIVPMESSELLTAFGNEEVYKATSSYYFRADKAASDIQNSIQEVQDISSAISRSNTQTGQYDQQLLELEGKWKAEKEKQKDCDEAVLRLLEEQIEQVKYARAAEGNYRTGLYEKQSSLLSQISAEYSNLQKKLKAVRTLIEEALSVINELEKKQAAAKITVTAYETFLSGMKSVISEELYQMFLQELEKMKLYAGLDEKGFSVSVMKKSLQGNLSLLGDIKLSGFSSEKLSEAVSEMTVVKEKMQGYSMAGLWFSYGDIVVAEKPGGSILGFLAELLTTGVLELVGISKEEQSKQSLSRTALPLSGLEKTKPVQELFSCIKEVQQLFRQDGIGACLKAAGTAALDEVALELYSMKYFHFHGSESPYTKLKYEREYLIFGDETDKNNLRSMVLYLVAIRTLLCMVMILKQPDRMAQLDILVAGTVGFTGMPVLGTLVKYSILMLWAVEEALVETAALLQGKRIAVAGTGMVAFGELFRMNRTAIANKAKQVPETVGATYQDYLSLLSFTRGTEEKVYRAMDLIQENIRYRYNDRFRIRNLVTGVVFITKTELNPLFDTGFFSNAAYRMECQKEIAY